MKVKIGEKEYNVKVNNRVIYDIEVAFDDRPIYKIMDDSASALLSLRKIGLVLWHTIKDEIDYEDFVDAIRPNQYKDANEVVFPIILDSFETGAKKK